MITETCRLALAMILAAALVPALHAKDKTIQRDTLKAYLERVQATAPTRNAPTPGSLWDGGSRLADLAGDYKARQAGDLINILVVQDLSAASTGNVASDRSFKASSGIDGLAGRIRTGGVENLFSPHSSASLQGKAQATSKSSLRTSLAGRVVAVLANGVLVVEAERQLTMNNERQTVLVRGLVRPGDIAPDNSVLSNNISDLELEVRGKGVISDGTRPPNALVRLLLRVVGF